MRCGVFWSRLSSGAEVCLLGVWSIRCSGLFWFRNLAVYIAEVVILSGLFCFLLYLDSDTQVDDSEETDWIIPLLLLHCHTDCSSESQAFSQRLDGEARELGRVLDSVGSLCHDECFGYSCNVFVLFLNLCTLYFLRNFRRLVFFIWALGIAETALCAWNTNFQKLDFEFLNCQVASAVFWAGFDFKIGRCEGRRCSC